MEMQELFYREPMTRTFTSKVVSCEEVKDGWEIVLEDTAFYPEGGGQPTDTGTLNAIPVSMVKRKGGVIRHLTNAPLEVGAEVNGVLDWDRRYDNMQNHTAEHIFSGLVNQKFGYDNVGFHMDENDITVDFNGEIDPETLAALERATNEAIWRNEPVRILFPDAEELKAMTYRSKIELSGLVRIVEVNNCDRCACCGTHVASAGEIGVFKLISYERHRGGSRIRFVAGLRALRYFEALQTQNNLISKALSVKPFETASAVEKLAQKNQDLTYKVNQLTDTYLDSLVDQFKEQKQVIAFVDDINPASLKKFCQTIAEKTPAEVALVLSALPNSDQAFNYVLFSRNRDIKEVSKEFNAKFQGRGGSRDGFAQGVAKTSKESIETGIQEFFSLFA